MEQQPMNHRESSHRRTRYRHTETDRQRDRYDGADRRRDLTDGRTNKRSSSRGSSSGSQYRHSSYHPYHWGGVSSIERGYNREMFYDRERSYSRYSQNTRECFRESYTRCSSREKKYKESKERDNTRERSFRERSYDRERDRNIEKSYRERSCNRERDKNREKSPERSTTESVIFPDLWSTHMTEGDYLQLAQWRTEAIETETRSKAQSEVVKGSQSLPDRSCRKRPLETTATCDEGPSPYKRPAIHVNRQFVRIGQYYGQSHYWNGFY